MLEPLRLHAHSGSLGLATAAGFRPGLRYNRCQPIIPMLRIVATTGQSAKSAFMELIRQTAIAPDRNDELAL